MKKILSLGAGVQSTTVLLMSCKGELPKLDCAIFADTGWEPKSVYDHFDWLKPYSESQGIPVHIVKAGDLRADALVSQVRGKLNKEDGKVTSRWASIPMFTLSPEGKKGMIRRQCTSEYKIFPVEKFIKREILGLKPRQRAPKEPVVELWMGISSDEKQRARVSKLAWQDFHYPLITEKNMSRWHCLQWLQENYPGRDIPRSACIGCPYHSDEEWRKLRDESPEEFEDACQFDEMMRERGGMRGKLYLHRECVPLREVDLDSAEDKGQMSFSQECMGMCGV